jgi:hypothetical protein
MNPEYRRAALIATAVTVPLLVLGLLAVAAITGVGGGSSDSGPSGPPPLTASAPVHAAAEAAPCAKVLAELPVQLGSLDPRVVHVRPDTPNVVAWGDPAVVLACGVARPAALHPGSSEQVFNAGDLAGPYYVVSRSGNANVYTIVDRQPYVAITVPAKYQAADVLPALVGAVGKALPKAVCSTDPNTPNPDDLCTRRKD